MYAPAAAFQSRNVVLLDQKPRLCNYLRFDPSVLLCHNAGIAIPLIAATLERDMTSKPTDKAAPKPSRKARVRELYKEQGAEEAFTLGKRLKLKDSTLHSWFGTWRRKAAKAKAEKVRARTEKKGGKGNAKANAQIAQVAEAPIQSAPAREVQP